MSDDKPGWNFSALRDVGVSSEALKGLAAYFRPDEIEWRLGQTGISGNGQIWAMALAYADDRAIMSRLDEVCGPEHWKNDFAPHPCGEDMGVLCGLSIRVFGLGWVTKWDTGGLRSGEEPSIVAKGAISDAEKRAASKWGIGRYLYELPESFVDVEVPETSKHAKDLRDAGWRRGVVTTDQGKRRFMWKPPGVPKRFWPSGHTTPAVQKRLEVAREKLRQAIVARDFDGLCKLLDFPQNDDAFSPADVATLQDFVREEALARLPDGKIPDMIRVAFEKGLLRGDDFLQIAQRVEQLFKIEERKLAEATSP